MRSSSGGASRWGAVWSVSLFALAFLGADRPGGDTRSAGTITAKAALAELNDLIGSWRGVGQLRRGSARGAWRESGEWVWEFDEDGAAIRYDVVGGKHLKEALLRYRPQRDLYTLTAVLPDGSTRSYTGSLADGRLTLVSPPDEGGRAYRISVTRLNEKRTLVLYEARTGQGSFQRVAEVGYTREGTRLAADGATGPQCVVTGGQGTMTVSYQGQTYYVCCRGCLQAFERDPTSIIAENEERMERQRAERDER